MADNVVLNAGLGGDTVATDDVGGIQFQRIKVTVGGDGVAADASVSAPLPTRMSNGSSFITTKTPGGEVAMSVAIVDGAGNQVTSFGGAGGTSSTDDSTFTVGSGSGTPMMGVATSDSVDVNDVGVIGMTVAREMFTTLRTSIPAGTNNIGDVDVITVPSDPFGTNADSASASGTISAKLRFIAATGIPVTALPTLANVTTVGTVTTVGSISTSVTPGVGALNLGKAEDALHSSGDTGVMALAVRNDAGGPLAGTTGDYIPFTTDSTGALRVTSGSGGTSITDAAAFTRGSTATTPIAGVVETSAPTLVNGNTGTASITTGGALRVDVSSGGIPGVVEDAASVGGETGVLCMTIRQDAVGSTTSADGDFQNLKTDSIGRLYTQPTGPVAQDAAIAGNPIAVGYRASSALPSAMSANGDIVFPWATLNGATVIAGELVDDTAFSPATSRVIAVGLQADETATDSVDEGDIGCPRMTLDRKQITAEYVHALAGGSSMFSALSTAAVLTNQIKGTPGKVYSVQVFNTNAAVRYVRLYNQTGAPASTDGANILWRGFIPGNTAGAGFTIYLKGLQFTTGIGIRATTDVADNGTGALAANELGFNVEYA